jgi:PAS domain S-box-containing protein
LSAANTRLREVNETLEIVFNSMNERFFAFDDEWRFTYFNKHAEEQLTALGKDSANLIGKVMWEEFTAPPAVEEAFRRAKLERIAIMHEHFYPPLEEWVENRIYPMRDGGVAVFQRYVTDRKRAEEALHKASAELAHVRQMTTMGELAASIAHEINQPLAAVMTNGNAGLRWLTRARPDLEETKAALERIIRDATRANEVIRRIRMLVKKTDLQKTPLDLDETIQEVMPLLQSELRNHGVSLRMELSPALPPVIGDRVQLQQVLLNLIINGIEAMFSAGDRPKELRISCGCPRSGEVLVAVQDSGIGLDGHNADQIFEPFYTTKAGGLGMGLSISRSIIESHGGRLWANQNDGPGATFQFTLPAMDPAAR